VIKDSVRAQRGVRGGAESKLVKTPLPRGSQGELRRGEKKLLLEDLVLE